MLWHKNDVYTKLQYDPDHNLHKSKKLNQLMLNKHYMQNIC